ncbi:protein kinase [Candidatus Uhrbacteria bacterium]|nr:protein kinase [Candidatus Uhrbacteria bacterium]
MADRWADTWEIVRELGGGGQGITSLVRRRSDGALGVLKRLKDPGERGRRARMRREAVSLSTLGHPRVPRILEDATANYADSDTELFIVSEYVEGGTLADLVSRVGACGIEEARAFIDPVLDTLAYCHSQGVGHRDLKPDNVLLRNGVLGDPVLIDYGLSFNDAYLGFETPGREQLDNRFLHLPELMLGEERRDFRSDVTLALGLFFFVLTGRRPIALHDGDGRKPHERPGALDHLSATDRSLLAPVLARGFAERVDDRFSTTRNLRAALMGGGAAANRDEAMFAMRRGLAASDELLARSISRDTHEKLLGLLKKQAQVAREKLGIDIFYVRIQGPSGDDSTGVRHRLSVGLLHDNHCKANCSIIMRVAAPEIVVSAEHGSPPESVEFVRRHVRAFAFDRELQDRMGALPDYLVDLGLEAARVRYPDPGS